MNKDSARKSTTNDSDVKKGKSSVDIAVKRNDSAWEMSFVLKNFLVNNPDPKNTEIVDSDAAIFVYPDSAQIEYMKKEDGDDFYIGADDWEFYAAKAREAFDSLKVKVVVPQMRYVKFVSKLRSVYFDTRAKASLGWITILFRTDSLPRIISAAEVQADSTLLLYFKRK